jgi:hypothetical protein
MSVVEQRSRDENAGATDDRSAGEQHRRVGRQAFY